MSLPPLAPEQLVKPRRFELRMALVFATLFVPVGIHAPYFPLWLEEVGFGPEKIAIILSAPMFLRVVTTPFITMFADKARDRATVYIGMVAASLLISLGYFLPPTYGVVLLVSLAFAVVLTPQSPLADSLALSGVRRYGVDYPKLRIWGSASFLVANFVGGMVIASSEAASVPVMISASLCVTLLVAFLAPRLGRPRRASPLSAGEITQAAPSLFQLHFLLLLAGAGIVNASHGYMFAFLSIYLKSLGIDAATVGMLWAWAVVAEVLMFLVFARVFGKIGSATVIALAAVFAIIRWCLTPLVWEAGLGVPGFFAVQSLHAFSTGLFLIGVQKLIAETVSEEQTGAAQGIAFFANGLAFATTTLVSGPLYDAFGANGFFAMAGVAFVGLILVGLAWRQPQRSGSGGDTRDPE